MQITVGIITVSDRASRGEYDDLGGPALKEVSLQNNWSVLAEAVVPDEMGRLQETIRSFAAQGDRADFHGRRCSPRNNRV